jgi:xanthine dehydrogenase accessory factor
MQDQAAVVRDWLSSGHRVAFARVINRVGFSGDTEMELLACNEDGEATGNLLAGTVADMSMSAMRKALEGPAGGPEILSAQVRLEEAVDAGLSCGGLAHVLVQPAHAVPGELWSALAAQRPVVLATGIGGPVAEAGSVMVVVPGSEPLGWLPLGSLGDPVVDGAVSELAAKLLGGGLKSSTMLETKIGTVLVEAFIPSPHVVVAGEGSVAEAVVAQAKLLGWEARVAGDAPKTDAALEWAGEAGAVVVISHDDTFGPDALYAAVRSGAFYIGAMGSRRTQGERAKRLTWLGLSQEDLARIHGPVGLDLGGRSPAEVALAICAEVLAVRTGREAVQLRQTEGSIRNRVPASE